MIKLVALIPLFPLLGFLINGFFGKKIMWDGAAILKVPLESVDFEASNFGGMDDGVYASAL
jgi:hypothetical protein